MREEEEELLTCKRVQSCCVAAICNSFCLKCERDRRDDGRFGGVKFAASNQLFGGCSLVTGVLAPVFIFR